MAGRAAVSPAGGSGSLRGVCEEPAGSRRPTFCAGRSFCRALSVVRVRALGLGARPRLRSPPAVGVRAVAGIPARDWGTCPWTRPAGLLPSPCGPTRHPGWATAARGLAVKLRWISSEFGTFKFSSSYVMGRAHFRAQHVTGGRAPRAPGSRLPLPWDLLEMGRARPSRLQRPLLGDCVPRRAAPSRFCRPPPLSSVRTEKCAAG